MIIKLSDCKAPIRPANDNGHTEWQDWFHVKPWATDSLFDKADMSEIRAMQMRNKWRVYNEQ